MLLATVAHEGSHVQSFQAFANGFNPNNPFDMTNNITHEESEKRAYQITHLVYLETRREKFEPSYCKPCAIGFGVAPVAKVNDAISRIVTSTAGPYAKNLGILLFPAWKPPERP